MEATYAATSRRFGEALCEIMGLPADQTMSITIECTAMNPPVVTAKLALKDEQGQRLLPLLRRYNLVAVPEEEQG